MNRRLPPEAFAHYIALGVGRSYQAVADHFGVSKTAVADLAARENWAERLREADRRRGEAAAQKAIDALAEMNERHLRVMKAIQARALEALKHQPFDSAGAAVTALLGACKQERVICGEPGERTAVAIEDVIRREYERWMVPEADGADGGAEAGAAAAGDPEAADAGTQPATSAAPLAGPGDAPAAPGAVPASGPPDDPDDATQ